MPGILMDNTLTYDDDSIIAAIDQEGLTSLTAALNVLTATFPSGNAYTWTYVDNVTSTPATVTED